MERIEWTRLPVREMAPGQHHSVTTSLDASSTISSLFGTDTSTFEEMGFSIGGGSSGDDPPYDSLEDLFVPLSGNYYAENSEELIGLFSTWLKEFIGRITPGKIIRCALFRHGSVFCLREDAIEKEGGQRPFSFLKDHEFPTHRIQVKERGDYGRIFLQSERWWSNYRCNIPSDRSDELILCDEAVRSMCETYPSPGSCDSDADTFAMWKRGDEYIAVCGIMGSNRVFNVPFATDAGTKEEQKNNETPLKEYEFANMARDNYRLDYTEPRIIRTFSVSL